MGKRRKVTTRDIAEYTELSQSTVSMILSGKANVSFSPETVEKVKKAAGELGYKKPEKKAAVLSGADLLRSTILVFAPSLANGYFSRLIHSITEHAANYNYTVMTAVTFRDSEREQAFLAQYRKAPPAGIIMLYPPLCRAMVNSLAKEIPVVAIGEKPSGSRYDSVELNGHTTGYMMGEYLISQGHRKIAYVSPPVNEKNTGRIRRYRGLVRAFEDHGLDSSSLILAAPKPLTYSRYSPDEAEYKNGYDLTLNFIGSYDPAASAGPDDMSSYGRHNDITAFVGHNDMTALGIMGAIRAKGYRIPQDYSVAGFDNIVLSGMPQINLTTIEHSSVQKGREAVELIVRKQAARQKKAQNEKYILRMEYEPELIVRGTVKKI
ncbi:MAG: LacI family DNA-binding transcriptional regulator [Eubacterium sp.]|nr:LacI family DNA-binding transcriptional regulator [Eubacterium sp.]